MTLSISVNIFHVLFFLVIVVYTETNINPFFSYIYKIYKVNSMRIYFLFLYIFNFLNFSLLFAGKILFLIFYSDYYFWRLFCFCFYFDVISTFFFQCTLLSNFYIHRALCLIKSIFLAISWKVYISWRKVYISRKKSFAFNK